MGPVRKFGVAMVVASVLAGGLGSATLEAKKKGGGGNAQDAICEYLARVINYEYVDLTVKTYALSLWNHYGCGE